MRQIKVKTQRYRGRLVDSVGDSLAVVGVSNSTINDVLIDPFESSNPIDTVD